MRRRDRHPLPSLLPLSLLIATLIGCNSVPADVTGADELMVAFYSFRDGEPNLVLMSEGHSRFEQEAESSFTVKQAPMSVLEELVEAAASDGFFEYATTTGTRGDVEGTEAKAMIMVEADGNPHSMLLTLGDRDAIQTFTDVQREVMRVFSEQPTMHVRRGRKDGSTFFNEEQERLQQQYKDATGGLR